MANKINESITEDIGIAGGNLPLASLSPGTYTLYLAATPAGDVNFSKYYLWSTKFTR